MNEPIIVGKRGGVDSSVTALRLKEEGFDVECVFMKNWEGESDQCDAEQDYKDALSVCNSIGVPLRSTNFSDEYWKNVFKNFIDEYSKGRTPNPDILCNKEVKFKAFLNYAKDIGGVKIATGHYARIKKSRHSYQLLKGVDDDKDQSYFLYLLNQEMLSNSLFPIGGIEKQEVRRIAKNLLEERSDELQSIDRDLDLIASYADNPYPRMRYDEAVETLQGMGVEIEWGQDLDYSKEKILTKDFEVPHFLTHYPKVAKPFYHRVDPDDGNYVLCHDLLAPEGYGEIIGGGERTWSEEEILRRIDEEGTPREPYQFYIDVRTYGGVPHGGFGLGVDRVCAWLAGADHIREVIPFPRDSRRVTP